MHHSLRLYSKYRAVVLKYYIFLAKWVHLPFLGKIVRAIAQAYGRNWHRAYLLTLEEANKVIDISHKLFLGPCACRQVFKNCTNPRDTEILVGLGAPAVYEGRPGDYWEISKAEAKEVLLACHERKLLPTLVKCGQDFYALCHCCSCCCVPLRLKKNYGIPNALVRVDNIIEVFQNESL